MVLYLSGKKKKNPFSFGIVFSAKCQKILMTIHWKALVRSSDLFKTNIKSPGVIFMRLNAAGSEFFHEIFCPQK